MNALGDLHHWIQHTGFAIGSHNRREEDIVAEQIVKRVESNGPAAGHWDRIDLNERLSTQPPSRLPHRGVFHRGYQNSAPIRWPTGNNSAESEVVGFGGPGRENNVRWPAPDERRDASASLFDRSSLPPTEPMRR